MSSLSGVGFGLSIFILVGIITESPSKIHSPLRKEENIVVILASESGNSLLTYDWSSGLVILKHKNVLHCESIVAETSLGLWLIMVKLVPYFLPSFAILSAESLAALEDESYSFKYK